MKIEIFESLKDKHTYDYNMKITRADLVLLKIDDDNYRILKSRFCVVSDNIKKTDYPEYFL